MNINNPGGGGESFIKRVNVTKAIDGNNETKTVTLFKVTGAVQINKIYGIVTSDLGNHTLAHLRIDDGIQLQALTSASGPTITGYEAGSLLIRENGGSTALRAVRGDRMHFEEPPAPYYDAQPQFSISTKPGNDSFIKYRYTTTDTPTTGQILFFVEYEALSENGEIVAIAA